MSSSTLERTRTSGASNARTAVTGQIRRWWSSRAAAVALVAATAVVVGLASGWATPRGPLTGGQVIVTTVVVFALGLTGGLALGSRWSMLLVPVVYLLAFEVGRIGTAGATVDAIHLGSILGVLAFVAGRVLHWLMILPPTLLGAGIGVWLADRLGHWDPGTGTDCPHFETVGDGPPRGAAPAVCAVPRPSHRVHEVGGRTTGISEGRVTGGSVEHDLVQEYGPPAQRHLLTGRSRPGCGRTRTERHAGGDR